MTMFDFTLTPHGGLFLLTANFDDARGWVNTYCAGAMRYGDSGDSIVIEARYVDALLDAIETAGFTVDTQSTGDI